MKNINDFMQEIPSFDSDGNPITIKIFDYKKFWEDDGLIYVVISERGLKAKSTQAKYLAKWIYDQYRSKTMWAMNTEELIKKEKKSHLTKPFQFHDDIFDPATMSVAGDFVYADKAHWYTKFVSISTAENEKGSRDDYELLVYDEFNIADRNMRNDKTRLISSLLATMDDPINRNKKGGKKLRKIIIHANFKSLNDDFLINLGITKIEDEVTDIMSKDNKTLLGRILVPTYDEKDKQDFINKNKNNVLFQLQDKLGQSDHIYFNENLFDEINFVNEWMISLPVKRSFAIHAYGKYYQLRLCNSKDLKGIIYIIPYTPKPNEQVFALHKADTKEGIVYNPNLKQSMYRVLGRSKMYFRNSVIRDNVIKRLRV